MCKNHLKHLNLLAFPLAQLVEALHYKPEGRGFENFSFTLSLQPYCVPGVNSASNRNEYQGSSIWLRRPVRKADNLTTFMRQLSRNSENLDLLEA